MKQNPISSGETKTEMPTKDDHVFPNTTPKNIRKRNSICLTDDAFRKRLKRLNIQDARTGLSLFEHVWSWRGNPSLDGVDALVATFHQFAATIDKSRVGVSRVIFELPTELSKHSGRQGARNNQNHFRLKTKMPLQERMEMVVTSTPSLRIVLFHDITKAGDMEKIDDLVVDVREEFESMFQAELEENELIDMLTKVYQSNPSDERNRLYKEIGGKFIKFEALLSQCIQRSITKF